jgi:hypothetical protein
MVSVVAKNLKPVDVRKGGHYTDRTKRRHRPDTPLIHCATATPSTRPKTQTTAEAVVFLNIFKQSNQER